MMPQEIVIAKQIVPEELPKAKVDKEKWEDNRRQANMDGFKIQEAGRRAMEGHPRYPCMVKLGEEMQHAWRTLEVAILDSAQVDRARWKDYMGRGSLPKHRPQGDQAAKGAAGRRNEAAPVAGSICSHPRAQ